MKGTLKIATMFKIPVYLHWSFPLIFLYILFFGYQFEATFEEYLVLTALFTLVFTCVVLHEYGHSLTARRFGVNTRDIILSPIGGIARLERIPERPSEELKIALAGPAVNVVIALILLPLIFVFREDGIFIEWPENDLSIFGQWKNLSFLLLSANVGLFTFNLIPAFPMDGGRVLRSALAMKMNRVKATKIAFLVAQVVALGMFIFGLYASHYILCFIAIFVVFTSRFEWKHVAREGALAGKTVKDLMQPIAHKLYGDQKLSEAIALNNEPGKNFLVFNRDEQVTGVLFHQFVNHAIKANDSGVNIENYQSQTWEFLSSHYPLENAIALFQHKGYGILPIVENGSLIGQLDMATLNKYVKDV